MKENLPFLYKSGKWNSINNFNRKLAKNINQSMHYFLRASVLFMFVGGEGLDLYTK